MAKKKRHQDTGEKEITRSSGEPALSDLVSGKKAKWIFFTLYFLVTVILFRAFLFDDVMLFATDTIPDGVYTRQYYKDYHEEFGGIPRWNPLILGGLPFIDAMHGDTFYPGAWLKFFMPLTRALGHKLVWHVFLAGIFMYIFLRTLRIRREAAFLGGLMYMLAPSFVTLLYSGHDAKMYVIAFLPLAFALLETGMKKPRYYTFAGLGAVMGLLILTSHVQMAYYSYWALGLYFLFRLFTAENDDETIRSERAVKAGFFVLAVIIALTLGAVQLLPAYKFTTTYSVRAGAERTGYEYATSWAMNPEEAVGMVVPAFPGFEGGIWKLTKSTYWGRNFFKLNTEYHGILPVLCAVLAMLCCRNKKIWFFLGLALLSLVYALGANTPLYRLFYTFVPGVKNFRAPSMIIFLFLFALCVMTSTFLGSLLDRKTSLKEGDSRLFYASGALIAVALIGSLAMSGLLDIWQNIFHNDMIGSRVNEMRANITFIVKDLWRVVFFMVIVLSGLWMYLSKKIGIPALTILIALVAFVDGSVVDSRFIKVINPSTYAGIAPGAEVREIQSKMENQNPFRILGLLMSMSRMRSPNYYAMFGIQSADGHHNNELQSYELFKGGSYYRNFTKHWLEDDNFYPEKIPDNNFLRAAGVKYILIPTGSGAMLRENTAALGRAYIVHDYVVAENDTLAVEMLGDSAFDPGRTVIIDEKCNLPLPGDSGVQTASRVKDITYTRNGVAITVNCTANGLLVLSENHVPYWQAYIDGEEARIYRAYGTFMAVQCPAGTREVSFEFMSPPFKTGKKLTLASLLLVAAAFAVSCGLHMKSRKKNK